MRVLYNFYFLLLLVLGGLVYLFQQLEISLPFLIKNYFNDLLILPIVLWIVLAFFQEFKGKQALISWSVAMLLAAYYSVFFEWYLPRFHPRYTADFIDVICYFLGSSVFMVFQSKIIKVSS